MKYRMIFRQLSFLPTLIIAISLIYGCDKQTPNQVIPEVTSASFSPVGDQIIFSYSSPRRKGIYLMNDDGIVVKKLTKVKQDIYDYDPVYSPDGSKIAFVSNREGENGGLYLMDAAGSNLVRLTKGKDHDTAPIFSPDGKRIYFLRSRWFGKYSPIARPHYHDQDIFSIGIDGSDLRAVTDEQFYQISEPSLLPDQEHMILQINNEPEQDSLWMLNLSNTKERESIRPNLEKFIPDQSEKPYVTQPLTYNGFSYPIVSPDGKWLAFSWPGYYQGHFGHELYLMNLQSKETFKLTGLRSMVRPLNFSPDSKKILFLTDLKYTPKTQKFDSNLWEINRDGTGLHNFKIDFSHLARIRKR